MDTQTGELRELLERKLKPTEVEVTAAEAAVLSRYVGQYRPELLRRWRAGDLILGMNGLLREAQPPARGGEQRRIGEALDRFAAKKARQHRKAIAAASRRKGRRH